MAHVPPGVVPILDRWDTATAANDWNKWLVEKQLFKIGHRDRIGFDIWNDIEAMI